MPKRQLMHLCQNKIVLLWKNTKGNSSIDRLIWKDSKHNTNKESEYDLNVSQDKLKWAYMNIKEV